MSECAKRETFIQNSFIKYSPLLNIINNKLKDQFSKKRERLRGGGAPSVAEQRVSQPDLIPPQQLGQFHSGRSNSGCVGHR